MHHPPLRARLIAELLPTTGTLPSGILRITAYSNGLELLVTMSCAEPGRASEELARPFECADRSFCPRLVARWLAAKAMRLGNASDESLAWAERVAEEIVERLFRSSEGDSNS